MRAREIPRSKARWRFVSIKENRMIHCESSDERDFCHFLEFDRRVRKYQEQPLAIEYVLEGELHDYFVDFLVEMIDGRKRLIEVKSSTQMNDEVNLCKFTAARSYAEEHGMEFIVVTEKDLDEGFTLKNMKLIYRHAFIHLDKEMIMSIIAELSRFDEATVAVINDALVPIAKQHDPRSLLLWLIWKGKVIVDIKQRIESSTLVKINHR